jgi:hypothetical protein
MCILQWLSDMWLNINRIIKLVTCILLLFVERQFKYFKEVPQHTCLYCDFSQ